VLKTLQTRNGDAPWVLYWLPWLWSPAAQSPAESKILCGCRRLFVAILGVVSRNPDLLAFFWIQIVRRYFRAVEGLIHLLRALVFVPSGIEVVAIEACRRFFAHGGQFGLTRQGVTRVLSIAVGLRARSFSRLQAVSWITSAACTRKRRITRHSVRRNASSAVLAKALRPAVVCGSARRRYAEACCWNKMLVEGPRALRARQRHPLPLAAFNRSMPPVIAAFRRRCVTERGPTKLARTQACRRAKVEQEAQFSSAAGHPP